MPGELPTQSATLPSLPPAPILALILALVPGGCASGDERPGGLPGPDAAMRVTAYNPDAKLDTSSIGAYVVALDRSIQQWNHLFLTGDRNRDGRTLQGLEQDIQNRTLKLFGDVVAQLETGPPYNRRVAAAALGFSGSEMARSPLLNALADEDDQVVANALLGLAVLGDREVPLQGVLHLLKYGSTEQIRSNAALAILEALRAGAEGGPSVVEAARLGLGDQAPFVRSQCALVLAHQLDTDSIEDLQRLLHEDGVNSPAMAASRALAYMGSKRVTHQGRCARALTSALSKVNAQVKSSVLSDLEHLAARRYAKDEDWVLWSHGLGD